MSYRSYNEGPYPPRGGGYAPRRPQKDISAFAVTIPGEDDPPPEPEQQSDFPKNKEELLSFYECEQLRKLFIGNISYATTQEMLREYFSKYGEIQECNVPLDVKTKLSKGFGFVIFSKSKGLDNAMRARPHKVDGRTIEPRRAIKRNEADNPAASASTTKLYLEPIPSHCTPDRLNDLFSEYGNVVNVDIPPGENHAFVTFDDFDVVDKCVNMKMHIIDGELATAKKGLTKAAMQEAEQNYHSKKRRRAMREEREHRDFDLARAGYQVNSGYDAAARHRQYPKNFGQGGEDSGKPGGPPGRGPPPRYPPPHYPPPYGYDPYGPYGGYPPPPPREYYDYYYGGHGAPPSSSGRDRERERSKDERDERKYDDKSAKPPVGHPIPHHMPYGYAPRPQYPPPPPSGSRSAGGYYGEASSSRPKHDPHSETWSHDRKW